MKKIKTIAQQYVNKYNDTEHSVTGFAPTYFLYGTDVKILPNSKKNQRLIEAKTGIALVMTSS